ncbi:universal stress protein [Actinoplanes sp. NPDC026670]|uniref:universal stress protein n=1 Tax=Actinoplanes sp. NPDC026670 TaxID=3154700 RepID=UPI00340108D2
MRSALSVTAKPPVVAGVGELPGSLLTVDAAAAEAVRRGVALTLVRARRHEPGAPPADPTAAPATLTRGRDLLDLAAHRVRTQAPGLPVTTEWTRDSPVSALLHHSTSACLLVTGHHDTAGPASAWGSTTTQLSRLSACPLLVCRGPACRYGPVVAVADNHSAILDTAYDIAVRDGSPLIVVDMQTAVPADSPRSSPPAGDVADVIDRWRSNRPQPQVDRVVVTESDLIHTVARASWRGRLLIGGLDSTGTLTDLFRQSTSLLPIGQRLCPVLLLPLSRPAG